jgi:type IV pilus assembly protein PilX
MVAVVTVRLTGICQQRGQRGISLLMVLVAITVMAFAALALLRSTDTSMLIAGNIGFQNAARGASDAGAEAAISWLSDHAADGVLLEDVAASGYYATSADGCDLTGTRTASTQDDVGWTGAAGVNCGMSALRATGNGIPAGYAVDYVINRLCNAAGDPNAVLAADGVTPMTCVRVRGGAAEGSTRSGAQYGAIALSGSAQHYYRITMRVSGPRRTTLFTQTFISL